MKNESGVIRDVKVGFSWTVFFFGGIPFFFRGMPFHALTVFVGSFMTLGAVNVIMCWIANKMTATYYLEHGYKPIGEGWDVAGPKWSVSVPR
jgi:hypothetical protein